MRTTKYEWICLARNATYGKFNAATGKVVGPGPGDTQLKTRQEQWIKAFIRPDKIGNEYVPKSDGTFVYTNENVYGLMNLKAIPVWENAPDLADSKGVVYVAEYGAVSYVYWQVVRPTLSTIDPQIARNWIPVIGVSNTTIGTRFNKHYECKISNFNKTVANIDVTTPPITTPPAVESFEQAEARLNTVIGIGEGIVNNGGA